METKKRKQVSWQQIRDLLLAITNDNGVVVEQARPYAEKLEIPYASRLYSILKIRDKIFNGKSSPHINEKSKEFFKLYCETDWYKKSSKKVKKELKPIQAEIQFEKPHPINNILGISAEHTIQNVNMNQLYDLNKRIEKIEKLIANKFQRVERFIRDWNSDYNTIN